MRSEQISVKKLASAVFYRLILDVIRKNLGFVLLGEHISIESFITKSLKENLGLCASRCSGEEAETTSLLIGMSAFADVLSTTENVNALDQPSDIQIDSHDTP